MTSELSPEYLKWNIAPKLLAIDLALFGGALITVVLRLYVRVFMLQTFGWDDFFMLLSAALSATCVGLFVKVITLGMGKHVAAVPLENIAPLFKYLYFYAVFIIFAYSMIKLSIGFFLLRLADRTKWRLFLQCTIGFLVAFMLGSTLAVIFQCVPVRAGWDISLKPPAGTAKCYPIEIFKNVGVFNSSINIATDLLFALIPIPIVWKLKVNTRTKIGLGFILGLGLFASATAIYKTPMQYNFFNIQDWTGEGSWYYIWQQVEMNVGIIAANLPTLKPIFSTFFENVRAITTGSNGRTTGISAQFKASGYLKQDDTGLSTPGVNSFAMSNISRAGPDTEKSHSGTRHWKRGSNGGESDESILREYGGIAGGMPRSNIIVRTTEVNIS